MTAEELVRRYHSGERAFHDANLQGASLQGANLQDVDFSNANLQGADLKGAYLTNADLARADLARAILWSADLARADLTNADLTRADLTNADLWSANLTSANLHEADLPNADIQGADLTRAILTGADLTSANLARAILTGADLTGADLTGSNLTNADLARAILAHANLAGANLERTDFTDADLRGANLQTVRLSHTFIGHTHLVDVDVTPFCDAHSTIQHRAPSFVDPSTVLRSIHAPLLKNFLAQAGVPEVFVEYMVDSARSLTQDVFKMLRSTFISYGHPDEGFARNLYEALHRNGVVTFFFPEHAVPGEKLHRLMRTKVNEFDRILLVCSAASLVRNGVLNEIEETLAREARDGGAAYLIPITIDDYVFTGWTPRNPDAAQAVRDRVVADFRGTNADPAKFQSALLKLIGALKK